MTKKKKKKFKDLFQKFAVIFTVIVLVLSAVVLIVTHVNFKEIDLAIFFTSEKAVLFYKCIIILAGIILLVFLISLIIKALIKRKRNRYVQLFKHHHIYQKKKLT